MLGVAMIFLGNSVLGNLNKQATSQESIGLPFWRLVIASGIIVFVMGFINLFAVSDTLAIRVPLSDCCRRALSSETPKPISQPDKSDPMVPLHPTKLMWKLSRRSLPAAKATIDPSSLAANAIHFLRIPARMPSWLRRQKCTSLSQALFLRQRRVLVLQARSTAAVPKVNDMP
jgi:hypothetical protein